MTSTQFDADTLWSVIPDSTLPKFPLPAINEAFREWDLSRVDPLSQPNDLYSCRIEQETADETFLLLPSDIWQSGHNKASEILILLAYRELWAPIQKSRPFRKLTMGLSTAVLPWLGRPSKAYLLLHKIFEMSLTPAILYSDSQILARVRSSCIMGESIRKVQTTMLSCFPVRIISWNSGEVGDVFDSAAPNIVQGSDLVLKSLWPSLVMDNKWTWSLLLENSTVQFIISLLPGQRKWKPFVWDFTMANLMRVL